MLRAAQRDTSITRVRIAIGALAVSAVLALPVTPVTAHGVVEPVAGGPPSWVVAGTRVTHHYSVATLAAGTYELVEDPNGPLQDPVTGKRYRESYTSGAQAAPAAGTGTGSGDGFLEVTVAAVEGNDVVLSRTSFANDPFSGGRLIGPTTPERVAGDQVGLAWIRPDLLATMKTGDLGRVLVLRGEVTVAGKAYQAVSLVDPTAGAYSFFAYDSVTGVMLFSALRMAAVDGAPAPAQMSLTELRGVRQLATPGLGAAVPGWLAQGAELAYAGTHEFVLSPLDPMNSTQTSTVSWRTKFTQVGATWALYESSGTVTSTLGATTELAGAGAIGGTGPYWWDPTALAGMTAGQVLDTDPHTGYTLTVREVTQATAGPVVVIAGAMPGLQAETRYDTATGVMVGQTVAIESTGTTIRLELQQMPTA